MKRFLSNIANPLLNLFGGKIISNKEYNRFQTQLRYSIHKLIKEQSKLHSVKGTTCLIFSKDRAIQLFALLETYLKFTSNKIPIFIIYNTSNNEHAHSYIELKNLFKKKIPRLKFIKENNSFRNTLLDFLTQIKTKNMFFLTDDNIFINKLDLNCLSSIDPQKKILSLRLNPEIEYSYTSRLKFKPPVFNLNKDYKNILEFNWFDKIGEWSDPWSVDGHLFSTAEILVLSKLSEFNYPNSYEGALKTFNFLIQDRKGLCFDNSKIMNIPMNVVQSEIDNFNDNISTEYLLNRWKNGYKIDVDSITNVKLKSTHQTQIIKFVKKSE